MNATAGGSTRARLMVVNVLMGFIVVIVLLAHQSAFPVGITWNSSASLPVGLYWHKTSTAMPKHGDKVCFSYRAPEWAVSRNYFFDGALLCKIALGLPGDRIVQAEDRVELCRPSGCEDVGRVLAFDSQGRPVQPAELPEAIPEGYVYLGIPAVPNSFDSRYLGLIDARDIQRTIYPAFVWESSP